MKTRVANYSINRIKTKQIVGELGGSGVAGAQENNTMVHYMQLGPKLAKSQVLRANFGAGVCGVKKGG